MIAARGRAVNKNCPVYLSLTIYFIMVAYSGHILESAKYIEIKLGTYVDVNERHKT